MNKNYDVDEIFEEIIDNFDKEDILRLRKKINDYVWKVYYL